MSSISIARSAKLLLVVGLSLRFCAVGVVSSFAKDGPQLLEAQRSILRRSLWTATTYLSGGFLEGMAVDAGGNVWAPNSDGFIIKLNSTGTIMGNFSVEGTPHGIAIDSIGNAWVVSSIFNAGHTQVIGGKLSKLNSSGTVLGLFTTGRGPTHVVIDQSQNDVWVTNSNDVTVMKFSSAGSLLGNYTVGQGPSGLAIDSNGDLWVAVKSLNMAVKLNGTTGASIVSVNIGATPWGVATDSIDNVWITCYNGNDVWKLSSAGIFLGNFSVGDYPNAIIFDSSSGNMFVENDDSVIELNSAGTTLNSFSVNVDISMALALDSSENLWVAGYFDFWVTNLNLLATWSPSSSPIFSPTRRPTTVSPTHSPSYGSPSKSPTLKPTMPTPSPSVAPVIAQPSYSPSRTPTMSPTWTLNSDDQYYFDVLRVALGSENWVDCNHGLIACDVCANPTADHHVICSVVQLRRRNLLSAGNDDDDGRELSGEAELRITSIALRNIGAVGIVPLSTLNDLDALQTLALSSDAGNAHANVLSLPSGSSCLYLNLCSTNSSACALDASTPQCGNQPTSPPTSPPTASLTGAIAGGTVGGAIAALLALSLAFVARRRIRYRHHYGAFLSHYKDEARYDVRIAKDRLEAALGLPVFLDSDDLGSVSDLVDRIKALKGYGALVLFLTPNVYSRPYVLCEVYAAILANVPIVTVEVMGRGFDYNREAEFLKHIDELLEVRTPGATQVLEHAFDHVDVVDLAYKLSSVLPNIVAKKFYPEADNKSLQGNFESIAHAVRNAKVRFPGIDKELWLERRKKEGMF